MDIVACLDNGFVIPTLTKSELHLLFALWMGLLSMKVKFDNKILQWLGTLDFSIFILQLLPMIVLTKMGINQDPTLFLAITIPSALVISYLYNCFLKRMNKYHLVK